MSKVLIRAPHVPVFSWPLLNVAGVVFFAGAVLDVLVEANRLASAARARYPLAD